MKDSPQPPAQKSGGRTIDECCGQPEGSFQKFVAKQEAHLICLEKIRKARMEVSLRFKQQIEAVIGELEIAAAFNGGTQFTHGKSFAYSDCANRLKELLKML